MFVGGRAPGLTENPSTSRVSGFESKMILKSYGVSRAPPLASLENCP